MCQRGVCVRITGSEEGKFDSIKGYSPRYAAPEVFARVHLRSSSNTIEDDKSSDVYSLGVVIWETTARQVRRGSAIVNISSMPCPRIDRGAIRLAFTPRPRTGRCRGTA